MAVGLGALSPVMTELAVSKSKNPGDYGFYDRSYRLRHNEGQLRADRFSAAGGLAGAGLAAATGASGLTGLLGGFALGCLSSGVYGMVTKGEPKQ